VGYRLRFPRRLQLLVRHKSCRHKFGGASSPSPWDSRTARSSVAHPKTDEWLLTGAFKALGNDFIVYQGAYGAGYERYVNDTSGLGKTSKRRSSSCQVGYCLRFPRRLQLLVRHKSCRHKFGGASSPSPWDSRTARSSVAHPKTDEWLLTGAFKALGNDFIVYQGAYGAGYERYLNDTSGLGIDAAPANAASPYLKAVPLTAVYGGYQHHWSKQLRSSVVYGFAQVENTDLEPGSAFHQSNYAATNLIWNPFGSLNLGAEVLYGWIDKKGRHQRQCYAIHV
jgi:hypothetical protein